MHATPSGSGPYTSRVSIAKSLLLYIQREFKVGIVWDTAPNTSRGLDIALGTYPSQKNALKASSVPNRWFG